MIYQLNLIKILRASIVFVVIMLGAACSSVPKSSNTPSVQLPSVTQDTHSVVNKLLEQYQQWKGVAYQYGGLSKSGVDCSGLVLLTFRDQFELAMPRSTQQQASVGKLVSIGQLRPGDLVLFNIGFKGRHIGIYAGEQKFLHASKSRGVIFSSLDNPYWQERFWQARRVL